jgi:hypothetical protein
LYPIDELINAIEPLKPQYKRNPRLVQAFRKTGLNQREGKGIIRIKNELEENGSFDEDGNLGLRIENNTPLDRFRLIIYKRNSPNELEQVLNQNELVLPRLPRNQNELEQVLNQFAERFSQESDQVRRQYDSLINLLSEAHAYNNVILNILIQGNFQPYDVWLKAEAINSEIFKHAVQQIQFSLHAISEITNRSEQYSIRRASIALIGEDGFLHMISSNVHPLTQLQEKIFKVGDTSEAGIAGFVAYTQKARRVADVSEDQKFKKFVTTPKYASLLVVPIMISDRVLGTLSVDSTMKNAFTEIDTNRVQIFSHSIATTIVTLMLGEQFRS